MANGIDLSTTYLPGPSSDGKNIDLIFNAAFKQPQIINKQPQLRSLVSPGLQEILYAMDGIYLNAGKVRGDCGRTSQFHSYFKYYLLKHFICAQGDTVVFYFSGYGRQLFRPEPEPTKTPTSRNPPEVTKVELEPLVGLMLSDAVISDKEIDEITDLTSVWLRYWCNALYLIKQVASVIILLDTSFSDPGQDFHKPGEQPGHGQAGTTSSAHSALGGGAASTKTEAITRIRSHRPHIMSNKCATDIPSSVQVPSWFAAGKHLDDPSDSLRVSDNLNECPYYLGTLSYNSSSLISPNSGLIFLYSQLRVGSGRRNTSSFKLVATMNSLMSAYSIKPLKTCLGLKWQ